MNDSFVGRYCCNQLTNWLFGAHLMNGRERRVSWERPIRKGEKKTIGVSSIIILSYRNTVD